MVDLIYLTSFLVDRNAFLQSKYQGWEFLPPGYEVCCDEDWAYETEHFNLLPGMWKDIQSCQVSCLTTDKCNFFMFLYKGGKCIHLEGYTKAVERYSIVSCPKKCLSMAGEGEKEHLGCLQEGIRLGDNRLLDESSFFPDVSDVLSCIQICETSSNCLAFAYDRKKKVCQVVPDAAEYESKCS